VVLAAAAGAVKRPAAKARPAAAMKPATSSAIVPPRLDFFVTGTGMGGSGCCAARLTVEVRNLSGLALASGIGHGSFSYS
jgi:hypothetical protein